MHFPCANSGLQKAEKSGCFWLKKARFWAEKRAKSGGVGYFLVYRRKRKMLILYMLPGAEEARERLHR